MLVVIIIISKLSSDICKSRWYSVYASQSLRAVGVQTNDQRGGVKLGTSVPTALLVRAQCLRKRHRMAVEWPRTIPFVFSKRLGQGQSCSHHHLVSLFAMFVQDRLCSRKQFYMMETFSENEATNIPGLGNWINNMDHMRIAVQLDPHQWA